MKIGTYPGVPVSLSNRCRVDERGLFFSRIQLIFDRLELASWSFSGRFKRTIQLGEVKETIWWTGADHTNLAIHLHDGDVIAIRIRGAGLWKYEIDRNRLLTMDEETRRAHMHSAVLPTVDTEKHSANPSKTEERPRISRQAKELATSAFLGHSVTKIKVASGDSLPGPVTVSPH